ncbi:hisA/hisF family protein [Blastopirellula marina]|uniref:HisA/hisF family protein n=1 Tax=Blastopirellula marina TaxID=124 RepID=A0A2S8FD73_9BACT|nr:hisA/hisF family protein [Blastopirellula marina]PTL42544.1 hisA/hisF family protein [Blastopirellula marina]
MLISRLNLPSEISSAVLPVIDLKEGVVVRGVGGVRNRYRPIQSRLCDGAEPGEVAAALKREFSFVDIYVADLDAIQDSRPQQEAWREIAAAGLRLHLDAGLASLDDCRQAAERLGRENVASLVVGLETLQRWEDLREIVAEFGDAATFSLDLRHGRPLKIVGGTLRPEEIAEKAYQCGIRRIVLLDLAHVGQGRGTGTEGLCRDLSAQFPAVEWITGGGIRSLEEVAGQLALGACRILVCSALHQDEKIFISQLQ